ncbi:MAG: hypothetical protein H0W11_08585 [Gemmatimonadetes bacterium]|nr:hypothetical protein [Gemmatimonadota bacterium]MBA4159514.1 hypothetical protein [Gemmatimonadota bacterium]
MNSSASTTPKRRRRASGLDRVIQDKDHLVRVGYYTVARQAFPSDAALAAAFPVHRSRITNWKRGEAPDEYNATLLRDLAVAVDELKKVYDPEVIADWLFADRLGGPRPIDLLREGKLAEVLQLINAASSGAYS